MEDNILDQSRMFVEFLQTHPLISIRGLERQLGVAVGTIGHALTENSTRRIPENHWYELYRILVEYGFEYPAVNGNDEEYIMINEE